MKKALITDNVHEVLLKGLEEKAYVCSYLPKIEQAEVEALIADYEILVINSKIQVNKKLLDKAVKLKYVARLGSGLEIIDLAYAKERGIEVINSPEGNRDAVGEHALGLLLSLFNNLPAAHQDVLDFSWKREERRGEELKGKTVGIIGYGNTGKAFAKKLSGFEVECLFYDKYLQEESAFAKQVALEEIQERAEVLSFHLPYNMETHHFFDLHFLHRMKKSFYLINTSRGKIVDSSILLKALHEQKLLGLCLDVFENEDASNYSKEEKALIQDLALTNKCLFSPHVAGWTHQSKYKLAQLLLDKIFKEANNQA
ncbi:MAG: phosphoglycerate dehydrogenase [Chitinophagales bacterium]|nr:phosphoglycerate dehydrogenase [Bacteroidota bacterium]MCB9256975.1 phosphoglycerate dehydrogenase [Chitinophagales bacterium]